jgi:hypothetical protein
MVSSKKLSLLAMATALGTILLLLVAPLTPTAWAQEDPEPHRVQALKGRLEQNGDAIWYLLPELEEGTVIYVRAERASGNLDPFVAVTDAGMTGTSLGKQFNSKVAQAMAEGQDPVDIVPEFADEVFVAWDDDSGGGFAANLAFQVPADGDYQLGIASAPQNRTFARFKFFFSSKRHITFYVIRILIPLGLIILVAWITFFLEDYGKRIETTSANLLLFIAFNFTISDDLPRLGYVTYLDALLLCTFVASVLVVIYNVYLKRQEDRQRQGKVTRVDKYMIWLYPLVYVAAFSLVTWRFFWPG